MEIQSQAAKKILVIAGPTASGKKAAAFAMAKRFGGEIVSADSRKVYRHLDIGTAKPSAEDRARLPHHLIDIIEPDEPFSAGDWARLAGEAVRDIHRRGNLPVISGGTGFYIKAFREGLSEGIDSDSEIRARLSQELAASSPAEMHARLSGIDPVRAAELHENDTFRVLRALEVSEVTGKPFSELDSAVRAAGDAYDFLTIGITRDREELYRRIDKRVDAMVDSGLVNEVRSLLFRGYSRDLVALDTVGYKEWFAYMDNKISFDECLELVKRNTRRYAKRQLTWFRAVRDIKWFDPDDPVQADELHGIVGSWLST